MKQYPKTARRIRGNTLVPVVIGLLIAALATVAFLNQGDELIKDHKKLVAINELTRIIGSTQALLASSTTASLLTDTDVTGFKGTNAYGKQSTFSAKKLTYTTTNAAACSAIAAIFKGKENISTATAPTCKGADKNVLEIMFVD